MNWGKAIVLTFIAFATFIGSMVFWMSRQRVDLVRDDYYQTELAYQEQMNRVARTAQLAKSPAIRFDPSGKQLRLYLPPDHRATRLTFYRPSDRQQDIVVPLRPDQELVSTTPLVSGYWRVQLTWTSAGSDYYYEQPITIP